MNIFRKVFHQTKADGETLEANAYIKASNIRIGILNPNSANLLIEFSPLTLKPLTSHYDLFSDILQETPNSFVVLIAVLKDGRLVSLQPEPQDIIKSKKNKGTLSFITMEETECSKKFGRVKSEQNIWDRLSRPTSRVLELLESKQNEEKRSSALQITIDSNFLRQKLLKSNDNKYLRHLAVRIKNTDLKNCIPWEYFTVDDVYIKKSKISAGVCEQVEDSESLANSTRQSSNSFQDESDNISVVENLTEMKIQRHTSTPVILNMIPKKLSRENDVLKYDTERSKSDESCGACGDVKVVETIPVMKLKDNKAEITTKTEVFDENYINNRSSQIKEMSQHTTNTVTERKQVEASLDMSLSELQEIITQDNVIDSTSTKLQDINLTESIHAAATSANKSLPDEQMDEILLSLVRNASSPISINMVTANDNKETIREKHVKIIEIKPDDSLKNTDIIQQAVNKDEPLNTDVEISNTSDGDLSSLDIDHMDELLCSLYGSPHSIPSVCSISDSSTHSTYFCAAQSKGKDRKLQTNETSDLKHSPREVNLQIVQCKPKVDNVSQSDGKHSEIPPVTFDVETQICFEISESMTDANAEQKQDSSPEFLEVNESPIQINTLTLDNPWNALLSEAIYYDTKETNNDTTEENTEMKRTFQDLKLDNTVYYSPHPHCPQCCGCTRSQGIHTPHETVVDIGPANKNTKNFQDNSTQTETIKPLPEKGDARNNLSFNNRNTHVFRNIIKDHDNKPARTDSSLSLPNRYRHRSTNDQQFDYSPRTARSHTSWSKRSMDGSLSERQVETGTEWVDRLSKPKTNRTAQKKSKVGETVRWRI